MILPVPANDARHDDVVWAQAHVVIGGEVEYAPGPRKALNALDGISQGRPLLSQ